MALQTLNPLQAMHKTQSMHPRGKMNKVQNFHYMKVMKKRVLGIHPHRNPKLEDMLPEDDQAH